MKVLILALAQDAHAAAVAKHLEAMNVAVDYLRFEQLSDPTQWYFEFGVNDHCRLLQRPNDLVDLASYSSIWHRRPGNIGTNQFGEQWITRMVAYEMQAAWHGILLSTETLWVNHPQRDNDSMHKLWQLELASQLGCPIPKTIVTNKPDKVRAFFDQCDGKVVYKLISEVSVLNLPPYEATGVPTLPLRENDLKHIGQVAYAPHIFQEKIEKTFDIRVTVVGNKILAGRIHSQTGIGQLDWRNDYSVKMEPVDLPEEVNKFCLDLLRKMRLNYGAIDFCETADGQFVFLEVNCAGQFLWLEERAGLPIAQEMAALLAGEIEPLTVHAF